jgi:hypothetical protein
MGFFTNTEKKIANALVGAFSKAKSVEETVVGTVEQAGSAVVGELKKVEQFVLGEEKNVFDKTREAALTANADVAKLKAALQDALVKSRDLHQAAIDAAAAAQAAAEADVARFKALAIAHAADLATQASQIVETPTAPVVEVSPVEDPAVTTPVVEPSMAQQFAAAQANSTPT